MKDILQAKQDAIDLADEAFGNGCSWDDFCKPALDRITRIIDEYEKLLIEHKSAVLAERERCAKIVEDWNTAITDKIAAEIRNSQSTLDSSSKVKE